MIKKLCPKCSKYSYSSSVEKKWVCPYCQHDMTDVKVENLTAGE